MEAQPTTVRDGVARRARGGLWRVRAATALLVATFFLWMLSTPAAGQALANPGATPIEIGPPAGEAVVMPKTAGSGDAASGGTEGKPLGAAATKKAGAPVAVGGGGPASGGGWMDHWVVRTALGLAVVLGLIVAMKTAAQRLAQRVGGLAGQMGAGGRAPSGVLEVLGRYPVARGQTLALLRVDRRVLLLCQSSSGFSTLAEFADPEEVASLLVKTRGEEGDSIAERFDGLLRGMERDPSIAGDAAPIEVKPRHGSVFGLDAVGAVKDRLAAMRGVRR